MTVTPASVDPDKVNKEREKRKAKIFGLAKERGFNLKLGNELEEFEYVPIGLPNLDAKGGACRGRFVVMYGPEGGTKTTLVYRMIAACQKRFPSQSCLLISPEKRNPPGWMRTQGVNLDDLLVIEDQECMEDYCEAALKLIKTGDISFVAVDTVSMMMPRDFFTETEKAPNLMDKELIALDARKIGQWIKLTNNPIFSSKTAMVLVSQARTHGIGGKHAYIGLSGGHMQRHMANQILQITPMKGKSDATFKNISTGEGTVKVCTSFKVRIKFEKDTGPNTGREVYLDFRPGSGFDDVLSIANAGVHYELVRSKGGGRFFWTNTQGVEQSFHGKPRLLEYFQANTEEKDRLGGLILEKYHTDKGTVIDEVPVEGEWVTTDGEEEHGSEEVED